jgi:hypothetical protein
MPKLFGSKPRKTPEKAPEKPQEQPVALAQRSNWPTLTPENRRCP